MTSMKPAHYPTLVKSFHNYNHDQKRVSLRVCAFSIVKSEDGTFETAVQNVGRTKMLKYGYCTTMLIWYSRSRSGKMLGD